jgi:hypothetical protein
MKYHPAPFTWKRQLPLDIGLAFSIIAILIALCLAQLPTIQGHAHLSAVLTHAGTLRMEAMERIAMEGVLVAPALNHPAPELKPSSDSPNKHVRFRYRHEGTSVIATGTLSPDSPPFTLSFNPAAPAGTPGWSVIWLCGLHQPPEGWLSLAKAQADNLLPGHLSSACKKNAIP